MIENEIKLKLNLKELNSLLKKLVSLNAINEFLVKQVTYRFDTPNNDLAKNGLFLRTRTGEINTITVKKKISTIDKSIKSRKEIETDIGKAKNVLVINKMLETLGYSQKTIMEKYRMQWSLDQCKIAIDELSIGIFVEIEGNCEKINLLKNKLNFKDKESITLTYWDLFEEYKNKNNIKNQNSIIFPKKFKSALFDSRK